MGVKAIYSIDDHYATSSTSEELLEEFSADMSPFGAGSIDARLTGLMKASGGATGTFRARIGGTVGMPDGTLVATITGTEATFTAKRNSGSFTNPAALTLVKLTGQCSSGAQSAELRGAVFTLRAAVAAATPPAPATSTGPLPAGDFDRLWGHDIWFDVASPEGADYVVTPQGDWKDIAGPECLRQSLQREWITNPGEWATNPSYGAGARLYVKKRNRRTERDALANRIRARALANPRIAAVQDVKVEAFAEGLKLSAVVIPKGQTQRNKPLQVVLEVR